MNEPKARKLTQLDFFSISIFYLQYMIEIKEIIKLNELPLWESFRNDQAGKKRNSN